jgi:hypothetical protein
MVMQSRRVEAYLDTVWAVAASPYLSGYVIGYTAQQRWARHVSYKTSGWQHMVILEDKLTRADAIWLEGVLQKLIKRDRRHTNYRKYDPERRDGRHYPSVGQATSDPSAPVHSVYMAWWE